MDNNCHSPDLVQQYNANMKKHWFGDLKERISYTVASNTMLMWKEIKK